jgi:hypothetical protein
MSKFIAPLSLNTHVALDYALSAIGFAGPWLFGFSHYELATYYTLGLAAFGTVLNLATDYPGGVVKIVPLWIHRFIELTGPAVFVLIPLMFFPDAGAMPWFLTAVGVVVFMNAILVRDPAHAH